MPPRRHAKQLTLVLIVAAAAAIAIGLWLRSRHAPPPEPIASTGGAVLDIPARSDGAYFLQGDPEWAKDAIGGSREPMSAVGCTICAVAMAASHLDYDISPKELNANLVQGDGYTRQGWLIWSAVSGATEDKIRVRVPRGLSHAAIDEALRSGGIPVVKFWLPGHIPHWVPIVGKEGAEYLIKDSLDKSKEIVPLSERTSAIVSVRYVEKV